MPLTSETPTAFSFSDGVQTITSATEHCSQTRQNPHVSPYLKKEYPAGGMKRFKIEFRLATLQPTRLWRVNVFVSLMLVSSGLSAAPPFVWRTETPCPLGRFEAMGGAAEGKLYQFSGFYNEAIDATVVQRLRSCEQPLDAHRRYSASHYSFGSGV